jgi:hypothetical protein
MFFIENQELIFEPEYVKNQGYRLNPINGD